MALEGIRVLDMTTGQQGPVAAQYMGDMGADVIKIEHPITGDFNRGLKTAFGVPMALRDGQTVPMSAQNRNKRGLAVDLRHPSGKEIMYALVKQSDIFLQNYRPGVAHTLGVDYETLSTHNPKLIYGSATCYGEKGAESGRPGNDLVATARSGLLFQIGNPDAPAPVADTLADRVGAMLLAYGLVLALFVRERTGVGQQVHGSLLGSMIHLQGFNLATTLLTGRSLPNPCREKAARPFWNLYKCKDGTWLTISHIRQADKYWPIFCRAIGLPEVATDSRFETQTKREENSEQLVAILDAALATKTYQEWCVVFRELMPDFLFDKAQHASDLASDPQVIDNEFIVDFEHPTLGTIKMEGIATHLSKTPGSIRRPTPELGEHTEEILVDLGYSWDQIAALKDLQVIR